MGVRRVKRTLVTSLALPRLRKLLKHESVDVRAEASLALGRSGQPADFGELVPLVRDEHNKVRRSAIYALGLLGNAAAEAPLSYVLKDRSALVDEQIAAALALGIIGTMECGVSLQATIERETTSADVKAASLHALGFIKSAMARVFLEHYYCKDGLDPEFRAMALSSLTMQRDRGALQYLTEAMTHKEVIVRRTAALSLGSLDFVGTWEADLSRHRDETAAAAAESAEEVLSKAQLDKLMVPAEATAHRVRDRLQAARTEAVDALVGHGLTDTDAIVQCFSAIALGQIRDPQGMDALQREFKRSTSTSFQAHAALALGLARQGESGATLLKTLRRRSLDTSTRAAVILAMGLGKYESAESRVIHELRTRRDSPSCGAAALALGLLGSRDELPRLRRSVLSVSRPELKPSYGAALSLLTDTKSVDDLAKNISGRRKNYSRIQSARALGVMRDERSLRCLTDVTMEPRIPNDVLATSVRAIGLISERGRVPVTANYYRYFNYTIRAGRLTEFAAL